MKVQPFNILYLFVLGLIVSCSTSNEVSSNSWIQKRKYQSGFHITHKSKNQKNINNEKVEVITINQKIEPVNNVNNQLIVPSYSESKLETDQNQSKIAVIETIENKANYNKIVHKNNVSTQENVKSIRLNKDENNRLSKKEIKKLIKHSKNRSVSDEDLLLILLLLLAFIIPPLAVLFHTNINIKKVLICLLLTLLGFFPGVLYAILVLLDIL
jgi:uncharacterized membrane protein YqaE (UPF0057 family)